MSGMKFDFAPGSSAGSRSLRGRWISIGVAAFAFIAAQANPPQAFAQSGTWNSSLTSFTSWSDTARWSGGIVAGGTDSTATFSNTATVTPLLLSNIVLGNLTTPSSRVTIRSGTQVNYVDLTNEQIEFAKTSGTPTINNTGRLDMFAIIAGSQGLTKSGAGALYLNRANTYTGTTTISAGDVRLAQNNGLGDSSAGNGTVIQSGAMLRLDNASTSSGVSGVQTAEAFTISGDGVGGLGALRSQAGTGNAFNGPITLDANASIKANVALTLGGSINVGSNTLTLSDNGDFTVSGGFAGTGNVSYSSQGSLILSGSSTLTGTTTVTNSGNPVTMTGYMAGPMAFNGSSRTLIGTGTFAGGLSVGSTNVLSPGVTGTAAADSYGTITASTLEVQSATVRMGIQTASIYDQFVMTAGSNGLTLGGESTSLNLDFANLLTNFTTLDLFNFTGLSGSFVGGVTSTGSYSGTWAESGGVFTLANVGPGNAQTLMFDQATGNVAVVPEPSTIVLLGGGVAAASLLRLRRLRSLRRSLVETVEG
jgi:fibronectin-binding autotransporter adhesin